MADLEQRYILLKIKDVDQALTSTEKAYLDSLLLKISSWRQANGKAELEGITIESDWPEYSELKEKLLKRIGAQNV